MTERSRDSETNRFEEEYSDEDFLDAIQDHEIAKTTDVAATLGCSRKTAERRLSQLEEEAEVRKEKVGPASVWSVVD